MEERKEQEVVDEMKEWALADVANPTDSGEFCFS